MKLKHAIDNLFSHNEIVALWIQTTEGSKYCFWRGMAWKLPQKYINCKISKIFGTVPLSITEADTINILVKHKPIEPKCKNCIHFIFSDECINCCRLINNKDKEDMWKWNITI